MIHTRVHSKGGTTTAEQSLACARMHAHYSQQVAFYGTQKQLLPQLLSNSNCFCLHTALIGANVPLPTTVHTYVGRYIRTYVHYVYSHVIDTQSLTVKSNDTIKHEKTVGMHLQSPYILEILNRNPPSKHNATQSNRTMP